ncbi:MAG: malto-oligosyltrehalose synthase [Egibacteraceae bacterium]
MPEAAVAPLSTYRLQLSADFGFADAERIVSYLAALGVSHLYLSPVLRARAGSTHGYDVVEPAEVSPALGGEDGLRSLAETVHASGLGLVVDIVPNHLGTGAENPLWQALLAEGRDGPAGEVFDVDWATPLPGARGKVVLPVLGGPYGEVLHAGELAVVEEDGDLRVGYYDHRFPLSPQGRQSVRDAGGADAFAGAAGESSTWQALHELLEAQHYRLVHWRAGDRLINYRRFFTIDELAGVRVEDEAVFERTHGRILELVVDGVIDGLRIDHPDGLRDPGRYFERVAERTGGLWTVVEKLTEPHATLPDWPVAGTTGYEFANEAVRLFVDADGAHLSAAEAALGLPHEPYPEMVVQAKREMLDGELAADLDRLARAFWAVTQRHPVQRDVHLVHCRAALAAALVSFDVYRTYVDPVTGAARPEDEVRIDSAIGAASAHGGAPVGLFTLLGEVLSGRAGSDEAHLEVLARFQQLSGAVMAKGVEDTVFYRYRRLLALNEVGGDPSQPSLSVAAFHAANAERAERQPAGMLTTATHDTKRGEDTRLRVAALSELGGRWPEAVATWHEANRRAIEQTERGPAPDPATELLIYQSLIGIWPLDGAPGSEGLVARLQAYAQKACREAGERTSWRDPDEAFEQGIDRFVARILDHGESGAFLDAFRPVADATAELAMVSGVAQVLLRTTSPGVPDTYQGNELWDDSLVDPDNRRPVDFARRAALLDEVAAADPAELWAARRDGRVKLRVLTTALRARRDHPAWFGPEAGYRPLDSDGRWAERVVAFARTDPDDVAGSVTVALSRPGPLVAEAGGAYGRQALEDTTLALPDGEWRELLRDRTCRGGEPLPLAELLSDVPVALLIRSD